MPSSMKKLKVALIGAGFIGELHATNLARSNKFDLKYISDADEKKGRHVADLVNAKFAPDLEEIFADNHIDSIWITSPAATHAELILKSVNSGKAVFCEKPVASKLNDAQDLLDNLETNQTPVFIGFNRRYDPTHHALKEQVDAGLIGNVEMIQITSRDPNPPPIDYMLATPGGIFYDTMIHDMDMACWLLGETPTKVFATAHKMIEGPLNSTNEADTATATLMTNSGKVCQINVSRRSVYGYDQRIEVFGSKGMLQSANETPTGLVFSGKSGVISPPLKNFFVDRYELSYLAELDEFYNVVNGLQDDYPGIKSGYDALALSFAALASSETGKCKSISN